MGLTRYKLGELIELVLKTNSELRYGPDDVRGMTITKEIIPTKADVTGTDLSKFLVVSPGEFIYNPRTHGKRIGFGYNNTGDTFIISWNNIAFKVKASMKDVVLADYLFLHFKRDEWDREACFQSWGSSTEVFSWETLCDMEVDLPPLPIQQQKRGKESKWWFANFIVGHVFCFCKLLWRCHYPRCQRRKRRQLEYYRSSECVQAQKRLLGYHQQF